MYRIAVMDKGRRLRLSDGCLLVLSLTTLILCTQPHGAQGQLARIDEPPQPQTAPLGANVTFECRGNGDIVWILDPGSLRLDQEMVRLALAPQGIYTEFPEQSGSNRLFVLASAENNQTIGIHCLAEISAFDNVLSQPAVTLTVFGLPLAPTGLSVEVKSFNEVSLNWTAPFTLPGENVTYTVEITNPVSGFSTNEAATQTEFEFVEPTGSGVCSPYMFRVFTENAVGTSVNPSNTVSKTFPTLPGTVDDITTSVSLESGPSVTLTFQTPILCVDYPPSSYTITMENVGSSDLVVLVTASGAAMESFAVTSGNGLVEDARYSAMVTATNSFGSTTSTGEYIFFTTDLQQFIVSSTSTTLDITCTLAAGSSALGCNVIAVSAGDSTPFWSTNLTRSGQELELTMSFLLSEVNAPSADYSIFAMDLEEDGSIGELQFSAEAPPTPTDCGIPIIVNGSVNYTTTVEGSTATYQCDTGLVPEGVITAMCMENGEWVPDPIRTGCRLPSQGGTSIVPIVVPAAVGASLLIGIAVVILILFTRHKKQQTEVLKNEKQFEMTNNDSYTRVIATERNVAYMTNANSIPAARNAAYGVTQLTGGNTLNREDTDCDYVINQLVYEEPLEHHVHLGSQQTCDSHEQVQDYEQPQTSGPYHETQDYEQQQASGPNDKAQDYLTIIL